MGGSAMVSEDGGKTFRRGMPGIAGDYHTMWLDPHNQDRYYVGNDKGASLTHDHGGHFNFFDNICIGQFYAVSADMRDPYYVYGGLQDNGIWGGPSNSRDFNGIFNDHWFKFHSGDGFYSQVDPTDWTTVYSESQGGAIRRNHALFRQQSTSIRPNRRNTLNWDDVVPGQTDPDRPVVRNNWSTPFILSPHNPRTLYYGANFLFKSVDRGDTWTIISPDLSTNDPEKTYRESGGLTRDVTNAETHCSIVTVSESPLVPGLIWTGTDDGNIHVTRNDGVTWTSVRQNITGIPRDIWVSRVEASHFDEGTCYVALDGHRSDIFAPFIFKTTDFGKTWIDITNNIPDGYCVYVVKEDAKNRNLLFAGTEFAAFCSVNGGITWTRLMNDMPTVAVHDLLIHPRDNDLIAGTHGRSIWIMDDITPLQQLTDEVVESDAFLFQNRITTLWQGISRGATRGHQLFIGKNPLSMSQVPPSNSPSPIRNTASIDYYLKDTPSGDPELEISDVSGENTVTVTVSGLPGINRYRWNMQFGVSEQQRQNFITTAENVFSRLRTEVTDPGQKDQLEQEYQRFRNAVNAESIQALNRTRQTLTRRFGDFDAVRALYELSLQRQSAVPGEYRLKLTVDGKTYGGTLTVREDPLLNALK